MKKIYLFLFFSFTCQFHIEAQSNDIEIKSLAKRYENHEFNIYEYKRVTNFWKELVNKNGYPAMPYDSVSKIFIYSFVFKFDNINKEIIYNRILEHVSMKYGTLSDIVDYQDYNLGKIILKIKIPNNKNNGKTIYYSTAYRFTILDNKVKINVFNMSIDYHYDVYDNGTALLTNYTQNYPLEDYFPVTSVKDKYWADRIKQLIQYDLTIRNSCLDIVRFIKSYQDDYAF